MSQQASDRIVQEVLSKPHIKGTRVDVLSIYRRVEGGDQDPKTVAERLDLDVADVYHALAYYYDHPEEMAQLEERREEAKAVFDKRVTESRPEGLDPDATSPSDT